MTMPDFRQMSPADFVKWQQDNEAARLSGQAPTPVEHVQLPVTAAEVAQSYAAAREFVGQETVAPGTPEPVAAIVARPAAELWGKPTTYDFTCPSGATCKMRKLEVEALLSSGIIDKVSRLPGVVQREVIDKAELKPPTKVSEDEMPTQEEIHTLMEMLNLLVPMAVVEPQVYAVVPGEARVEGRIYLDTIDLDDRVAIMNKSLEGVVKLDSFRAGA